MTQRDSALQPTRRSLLAAASAAGLAVPGLAGVRNLMPERKTKRVILIAFAGGVRTRETFGSPELAPNLARMAEEGVLYPKLNTSNLGHFGATMSLFTGIAEPRGIRENSRGPDPTVFEYLRKDLGLPQEEVWISTTGGAQQTNYAFGLHPEYGPKFGATTMDGDGIFNQRFQDLLGRYGKPTQMKDGEAAALDQLRRGLGGGGEAAAKEAESVARVEDYILQELSRGTADITGAAAGDRKALRLARNLLSLFKPTVIGVVLQNADVAHGSFNAYTEVIRRNDAAIGELMTVLREDEELASSTAVFVCPEFGRNADLNARRGLDHGDGSPDLRTVGAVAWGPDFKRGVEVTSNHSVIDVPATVCEVLGASARYSKGKRLSGLYA